MSCQIDAKGRLPYNSGSRQQGRASGFTLTEVLVAMAILAIGAVAALSLFAAAAATQKRAINRVKSARLATEVIALMDARLSGDVDLASLEIQGGKRDGYPDFSYDVSLTPQDDEEIEVLLEVTVRWESKGRGREAMFRTILLRSLGQSDYLGEE